MLEAGLIDVTAAYSDERPTNNPDNDRPPKRIDLILASPLIREQVVGYGLLGDADYKQALAFSDHVAVYADMMM